ncbi:MULTISPECIES: T6SS immunity protein Tdi1 domain-containing protein [Xenorhabdus]|uniref:DUF1851 domain-containing protein n=1 Tax=Xenorhabdus aichiensis TaxID=3025874 RepID=A0ABT5M414_9GAMM|nr:MULTISPECIES: T6SS immunity protein Tdi1 domain-containing protein [Xenorhabdus]MDC9622426.1 DUF1851 domain-containing protein [Xenorhabdus aichiensis]CDG89284.1 conserved hypothetical protein [Xenorhabdus bovienii str. feltiae France]CDG92755.1 conserved hypothetical protein [Xenorhabdus bovienii str. feltiae Florida]
MDFDISTSFSSKNTDSLDLTGESKTGVFSKAIENYGLLNEYEIFGFEPAIVLIDEIKLENVIKLNIHIHLDIFRQFSEPD